MYDFCGDAGHHHRSQDKHKQIPIKRGPKLYIYVIDLLGKMTKSSSKVIYPILPQ